MSSWKPSGYPAVSPSLICEDAEGLIGFVRDAFGGVVLRRFDRPDGSSVHAEVSIGDGVVMVGGGATDAKSTSPHIHLYVPDAAATFRRALAAGPSMVREPERRHEGDDLRVT